jgi:cell wall-associated NlpC family hydrolase
MTLVIERTSVAVDRAEVTRAAAARTEVSRTEVPRAGAEHAEHVVARHAAAARARAAKAAQIAQRALARKRAATRAASRSVRQRAQQAVRRVRSVVPHRRTVPTQHRTVVRRPRVAPSRGGMTAVIAFARSQVGKRYVTGGEGGSGFDCSGLTMRAYERAGIRLPHSSRAQAGRARSISRSQARAGDLVIGPGHVGIYMGNGMMIDAGNHRTGVVYRKLYSGLRVARL